MKFEYIKPEDRYIEYHQTLNDDNISCDTKIDFFKYHDDKVSVKMIKALLRNHCLSLDDLCVKYLQSLIIRKRLLTLNHIPSQMSLEEYCKSIEGLIFIYDILSELKEEREAALNLKTHIEAYSDERNG